MRPSRRWPVSRRRRQRRTSWRHSCSSRSSSGRSGTTRRRDEQLDAAAELALNNPDVLVARLRLLADEKRFDDVLAMVRDAPVQGIRGQSVLSAARLVATSPAHFKQAIQLCREATEIAPQTVGGYLLLGELTYGKGDLSAAEQAYRAAIKADPACAEALNNLAWILAQGRANYEEALVQARKAVELRPDDASFRDTLGLVLKNAGKLEEARDEFRQSVRLAGEGTALRAKSLFRLAQVCALRGDGRSIEEYLKEALPWISRDQSSRPRKRPRLRACWRLRGRRSRSAPWQHRPPGGDAPPLPKGATSRTTVAAIPERPRVTK